VLLTLGYRHFDYSLCLFFQLSRNTLKLSPPPVRALYDILEVTFEPLTICATVAPVFRDLAADAAYAPYLPLLHRVLVSRLLSQLSEVYASINISHFISLVAPLNNAGLQGASAVEDVPHVEVWDKERIEAFVMSAARRGDLLVRVDHAQGTITFTDDIFQSTTSATLQASPGTLVVTRVSTLANTLHNTLQTLYPPSQPSQEDKLQALVAAAHAERKAVQVRRAIVARRRELLSELSVRKEKEEASRKAEQTRREREEESKRAVEEIRRREIEKIKKDQEYVRTEEARKLAHTLREQGTLKDVPAEVCIHSYSSFLAAH
jgi:translation initiation factor 3 subunit A